MFPNLTEPERGHFDFDAMDEAMSFAKQNKMKLMGHTLIYRNMLTAPWITFEHDCGGWSAKELDGILKDHIQASRAARRRYVLLVGSGERADQSHAQWLLVADFGRGRLHRQVIPVRSRGKSERAAFVERYVRPGRNRKDRANEFFDWSKRTKRRVPRSTSLEPRCTGNCRNCDPTYLDEFKAFLASARKAGVKVHITEMDVYQGPEDTPQAFQKAERSLLQRRACMLEGFELHRVYDVGNRRPVYLAAQLG